MRKRASGHGVDLPLDRAARPTALLRSAGARILEAKSASAIARIALSAATEICAASSAVWWQRADRKISARHLSGKIALPKPFRFSDDLLDGAGADSALIIPPDHADGAALLAHLHARRVATVPICDGRRWFGLLTVQDGAFDGPRLDLLTALAQQAASALRSLDLIGEARRVAHEQRDTPRQFAAAFSSALSLDDLLGIVCRLAIRSAGVDACLLFLADEEGNLRLQTTGGPFDGGPGDGSDLLAVAELVRRDSAGVVVWHAGGRAHPTIGRLAAGSSFASLLGLGLSIRGEPLGAMLLLSKRKRSFSAQQKREMLLFSAQAAFAVGNLQLFESTQRRLLEVADLNWVSNRISADHSVPSIAATVADATAKALDVPKVAVFVARPDGAYEVMPSGRFGIDSPGEVVIPAEGNIGADAIKSGSPISACDAAAEGRAEDPVVRWMEATSILCAPMTAQPEFRGFLVVGDNKPRRFESHDIGLLSNYASQTALALQSALLYDDVVRHLNELSRLFQVSRSLASSLDLSENLNTVLTSAAELLDAPVCSVMLSDSATGDLVVKAAHGFWEDDELYERIRPGDGLAGRSFESATALTSSDLSRDGRFKFRQRAREQGLHTAIAAPLIARGRTLGVISLYRAATREFTDDDKRLLMSLADSAAVAIENADLYREAQERAEFLSAMMSEINHRIRNTLQAIAGLLRMELDRPQLSAESAIRRGISRIQVVAVVHELMRARELQFVDMKQVARRIVQIMSQAIATRAPIDVHISGARVTLPSQKATSVALVLAEVVDNSLRHGIGDMENGRIAIGLAEGGGEVVLQVQDNGVGLPDDFDVDAHSGFGLKIVRGLVEDELGGKFEIERKDGLLMRFRFPKV